MNVVSHEWLHALSPEQSHSVCIDHSQSEMTALSPKRPQAFHVDWSQSGPNAVSLEWLWSIWNDCTHCQSGIISVSLDPPDSVWNDRTQSTVIPHWLQSVWNYCRQFFQIHGSQSGSTAVSHSHSRLTAVSLDRRQSVWNDHSQYVDIDCSHSGTTAVSVEWLQSAFPDWLQSV